MSPGDVIYGAPPASYCLAPGKRQACRLPAGHESPQHAFIWWGIGVASGLGGGLVKAVWGGAP